VIYDYEMQGETIWLYSNPNFMKMTKTYSILLLAITLMYTSLVSVAQQRKAVLTTTAPDVEPEKKVSQPSGTRFIERVSANPGEAKISYSKFMLHNGLTLLVHEDHSSPVVHVEVTYKVGSSRELPGRSGFAHFFEHMMFQGSEHVADEEHFKIIQQAGGNMNGTTSRDRTNYFQTVPAHMLETVLWLEADRMGFLPNAMTNEKFEVQRSTVKNEMKQTYGAPYGFLSEVRDQLLYGTASQEHPYSWPIIGFEEDLNNATRNDMELFFLRYYGPNNAILVISGDVNTDEVVSKVEKYFNPIPAGPAVGKLSVPPVRLPESQYKTYYDNVFLPLTYITYPTVPSFHPDEAALDMLSEIMAGSKSSIFHRNFIKEENAIQASVSHPTFQLSGEFTMAVLAYPNMESKFIRDLIAKTLEDFEKEGFTDEDLEMVKTDFISNYYDVMESNMSKSSTLTSYELSKSGQSFNLDDDINRYRKVTKADVLRVYNKYIKNKPFASITVERDPILNQPGGKMTPYRSFNPFAGIQPDYSDFKGLTYQRPVDTFDRSVRPSSPPSKPAVIPGIQQFQLENGIKVMSTGNEKSPRVMLYLTIDGGQLLEDGKKFPYGTAYMTAEMMNESTIQYPSVELERALRKLGTSISFSGSNSGISCIMSCFNDKVKESMELLEQMLLNPNFEPTDFNLLKKRNKESIANQRTNPSIVGQKAFMRVLYGNDNPLGKIPTGNFNDFNKIRLEHVVNFYNTMLSAENIRVVVVGNLEENAIRSSLKFMSSIESGKVTIPTFTAFPEYQTTQMFTVNVGPLDNAQIMMGFRSLPYDATGDFFKANVMNFALGGNFNSRLNLTIREDKGWTYGINSRFYPGPFNMPGYYMIGSSIKGKATDSAIAEVLTILHTYKTKGITEEELAFTKEAIISSDALNYETVRDKASFLNSMLSRNLPPDYRKLQGEIVSSLTVNEVNQYIQNHLHTDKLTIVVVGNIPVLKSNLEGLNLGKIQTLDTNGDGKIKIFKKK